MSTICRCSVKECTRTSRNFEYSFFRFPKDVERAKIWAIACKREDLMDKLDKLHNSSYRVCGAHFKREMFTSGLKNRLQRLAVPTIFPQVKKPSAAGPTIYIVQLPEMVQVDQPQSIPGTIMYANPMPPLQRAPSPNRQVKEKDLLSNEGEALEKPYPEILDDALTFVKEEHDIEVEDVKTPLTSPIPEQMDPLEESQTTKILKKHRLR